MKIDSRQDDYDDYDVFALYDDDPEEGFVQESIGSVSLIKDARFIDMPRELEINGFIYCIEE